MRLERRQGHSARRSQDRRALSFSSIGPRRPASALAIAAVNPRQRASAARSKVPPEPGEMRGHGGERPCSIPARAPRAIPAPAARGGRRGGVRRWERSDGGRLAPTPRAMGRPKEREVSRGGESEAKAAAVAGRGAVRAKRGGAAADFARSATPASGAAPTPTPRPRHARSSRARRDGLPDCPPQREAGAHAPRAWELHRSGARLAHGQRAGRRWRWRVPDAKRRARRRARLDWRRGQPRASEG